jgi:hypothetical protein
MNWLCKTIGHHYSYYWICTRCGDHAVMNHITEMVRAAVREAKKETATAREAKKETATAKPAGDA